jgi:hypothetical protein
MAIYLSNALSIGTVIDDGTHQPFCALACPLNTNTVFEKRVGPICRNRKYHAELVELFS